MGGVRYLSLKVEVEVEVRVMVGGNNGGQRFKLGYYSDPKTLQ